MALCLVVILAQRLPDHTQTPREGHQPLYLALPPNDTTRNAIMPRLTRKMAVKLGVIIVNGNHLVFLNNRMELR